MAGFQFAFQSAGLEREEPLRGQSARLDVAWADARVLVLNDKGEACPPADGEIFHPAARISLARPAYAALLGFRDGQAYFAVPSQLLAHAPVASVGIRTAAGLWPDWQAALFAQAKALLHWQSVSKFCGRCGGLMSIQSAGYSAVCASCGLVAYPQSHPAVIMCVSDGEKLLLGRQASWPERRWSLLAGFVESGESPEQTVLREVHEESGVRVGRVRYVASQPWPMPMALMLGFDAYAEHQPIVISEELQAARWFGRDELRALAESGELQLPDAISISRALIERWLADDAQCRDFWHTGRGKGGLA